MRQTRFAWPTNKPKSIYQNPLFVLALFLIVIIVNGCTAVSQQPETFTIGVINLAPVLEPIYDGFRDEMNRLGYVDGVNVTYLYAGPVGDIAKLDEAAQELVAQQVDLILALSTPGTLAAQRATQEIPIIFAPISDPLATGIVTNLAQPGGNATGVQWALSEPRRLQWLVDIAPAVQTIYIPYNPDDSSALVVLRKIEETAAQLGLTIILQEARNEAEITAAVDAIPATADAIFLLPDNLVVSRIADFVATAIARQLPLTAPGDSTVVAGGLVSYGLDFYKTGEQSARMARQILQGTPAGSLPVETSDFFLSINLKTAAAIGLEIPESTLRQADTLIRE